MLRNLKIAVAFVLLCGALALACSEQDQEEDPGIGQNPAASDCGGFDGYGDFVASPTRAITAGEDFEILIWSVVSSDDTSGATLSFLNKNICLNCCGDHTIKIFFDEQNAVYEIAEVDKPLKTSNGDESRCFCECIFDYGVELPGILVDKIYVRLTRNITDWDEGYFTVWEGEIDLTSGGGEIYLEELRTCT